MIGNAVHGFGCLPYRQAVVGSCMITNWFVLSCVMTQALTRALERGGGQILSSPHVFFVNIFRSIRSIAVIFFNTCPKINGAPFGAKIEDASIFGGLFLSPQSQHFRFSPS